jgi:hypothetical protein
MFQEKLAQALATKLWTDVHPLDLAILGADQQHAAAAGGNAVATNHEKIHALAQELLHAKAMPTFPRVKRFQNRIELRDKLRRISAVGSFLHNGDWHGGVTHYRQQLSIQTTPVP